ncbi:winged helix-turn-helix transcriptional regulator [[Clostridium] spiroforme]|nr:winged helix-turn-helix transcriptional regulator [Thomasclavelia spiroformis]MBM6880532.1 winged helix-turn-helix transcriptional regulator [Thomasclavelia spiroformis]
MKQQMNQEKEETLKKIINISNFQILAESFKQLGDSNRLRIFWLLCHCEENVMNISQIVNMTSPAVSHHLKQLKSSHLICSRRNGKEMFYRASTTPESKLLHRMIEELMKINCPEWY